MTDRHCQQEVGRNLLASILMNVVITVAEVAGGLVSGSLALLADAMHNATDTLSGALAY